MFLKRETEITDSYLISLGRMRRMKVLGGIISLLRLDPVDIILIGVLMIIVY